MSTGLLDCGHAYDAGHEYDGTGRKGWTFSLSLDGTRKLCHACSCLQILDCGHAIGEHSHISSGYGTDAAGVRSCYQCCADKERASMIETGRATLYIVSRDVPASCGSGVSRQHYVTDWPGKLEFRVIGSPNVKRHGGGFGSQRTDAWFRGPDGFVWRAVNRGDSQIARCKRTKERAGK